MNLPADLALHELVLDGDQAVTMVRMATARVWRSVHEALELARRETWIALGTDSRVRGDAAVRLAEASAVAELAVRFTVSEGTIRSHAHTAEVLLERLPGLWARFADGMISEQNAAEAARLASELPAEVWSPFDALVGEPAETLTPAKFRLKARGLRERLHPTSAQVRHERAREERRVWFEPDRDGMGWFGAYLPVDVGHTAMAMIDGLAFESAKLPDETRTMSQLRADVFGDLLVGPGSGVVRNVSLALTMPVLTATGNGDVPAVLDGVGPIPLEMAKVLAGEAKSFVRVLTDPISGTVLNMESKTRRIPKAMRRWLRQRDQVCTFPGCNRRAMHSDLDHTRDVQYDGVTANGNLAHLCRRHHTLKHKTNWRYVQPPAGKPEAKTTWTSPLGYEANADPPPF